jgi:hypothetical protein
MQNLLPLPFLEQIPRWLQEQGGAASLADKSDETIASIFAETIGLETLRDPGRAPSVTLDELGYMLGANVLPYDSDATKRSKIAMAVSGHKNRGLWLLDAKIKIDTITGFSATVYTVWATSVGWLIRGDGIEIENEMATLGGDGIYNGLLLIGQGTEPELPGNVYIDTGTSTLTSGQVGRIVYELALDVVPAYFRIFIGYTSAGEFIVYPNGQIG